MSELEKDEIQESLSKRIIEYIFTLKTFTYKDLIHTFESHKACCWYIINRLLSTNAIKRIGRGIYEVDEEVKRELKLNFKKRNVEHSIKSYILSKKIFDIYDLQIHFQGVSDDSITFILWKMIKTGEIRRIGVGQYEVIKVESDT